MINEFKNIKDLERRKLITIGVYRTHANNFWYRQTASGKVLNLITYLLIVFSIFSLIKFGFIAGVASVIGTLFYVTIIQKIADIYMRICLLNDEAMFDAAYESRSITIRNNLSGEVCRYPNDWRGLNITEQ